MIHKWEHFLFESNFSELILEGHCTASDDFLARLKSISESPVAKSLYSIFWNSRYSTANLAQNYIEITNKDNMVSFLSDLKADQLVNYGMDEEDLFSAKGRSEIAVGRMARAILSNKELYDGKPFTDKEYEDFVNLYKSKSSIKGNRFELVTGDRIADYYDEDQYAGGSGTLGSSCMRGEDCQEYFGIYTDNTNVCSLLVYLNSSDKVLGRALVWNLSESPSESKTFMDRIYTIQDSDVNKFITYADEKGWMYKYKQSAHDLEGLAFKYQGGFYVGRITVELRKAKFENYPFVDTLSFLNLKKKTISNVPTDKTVFLDDTEGDYNECFNCDGKGTMDGDCPVCDGYGSEECPDCSGTGESKCPKCNGDGTSEKMTQCPECNGEGKVRKVVRRVTCQTCKGTGQVHEICSKCDGDGDIECKMCGGSGDISCKTCDGDGRVNNVECRECVGFYKKNLEMLGEYKDLRELAKAALEKYLDEKQEQKKKEDKKK